MFQLNFFLYFFVGIGVLSFGCFLMGVAADDLGGRLERALRRWEEIRKRRRMNGPRTNMDVSHFNGSKKSVRIDDAFEVYLIVISTLFAVVRESPGLARFSTLNLVTLVSVAIVIWIAGYVFEGHPWARSLKLSGWLLALNETAILYIFAVWEGYLGFVRGIGMKSLLELQLAVFATVVPPVLLGWWMLKSIYSMRKGTASIAPLLVGLFASFLISMALIY
jgi:hypothetical protein